jgi:hypothetical protein
MGLVETPFISKYPQDELNCYVHPNLFKIDALNMGSRFFGLLFLNDMGENLHVCVDYEKYAKQMNLTKGQVYRFSNLFFEVAGFKKFKLFFSGRTYTYIYRSAAFNENEIEARDFFKDIFLKEYQRGVE